MKNIFRGIALLLFALVLAVVGLVFDEILLIISLAVGVLGLIVTFWDGIASGWRKLTALDPNDKTDENADNS